MIRRRKAKIGDVFTIDVDDRLVVCGQIVGAFETAHYLAVFAPTYLATAVPEPADAVSAPIELFALSFDALIRHGEWKVVGSAPVAAGIPFPA